jgi:O-antigen/teichoic acid export membrane protein
MSNEPRVTAVGSPEYGNAEQVASAATPAFRHLDVHLIDSVAWTAVAKWSAQLASWAGFLVVARLLSPADFGLLSLTTVYLGLVALLSEFGIGAAIVNLQGLTANQIKQMNGLAVLCACGALVVSFVVSRPIANFFRVPELFLVLLVMSTGLLLSGLRGVPQALMQREMRFRALAAVESSQTVVQVAATIVLAALGARYWALVIGGLIGPALGTVCLLVLQRPGFAWPRVRSLRRMLSFGWAVLVANVCWYAYSNADFIIAGKLLGRSALGAYSLAWTLANTPGEKIATLIMRVTPSFFAACQNDHAALRRYTCRLTQGISIIIFPATLGLATVARDFVHLVLGNKWEQTVTPLILLCLYAALGSTVSILPQVLNAVGRQKKAMWNSVLKLAVLPAAFYIGSRWGGAGIAAAWVITYPFLTLPLYWWTLRAIELSPCEYLRAFRPAAVGSIAMILAVSLAKLATASMPLFGRFAVEVLTGSSVYLLVMLTLERDSVSGYFSAIGNWRRSGLQMK